MERDTKNPPIGGSGGGGEGEEDDYNDLLCLLGFMFSGRKYTAGCSAEKTPIFMCFGKIHYCRLCALKEIFKNSLKYTCPVWCSKICFQAQNRRFRASKGGY
jgi:hypothetical protein